MKNPKVSVVMPVYNAEAFLKEAADSVLNQTFSDFEFIMINDGSKDGSAEIIRSMKDPRIIFADHSDNKAVVARLNEGLALARGEYIARIDSDDVWTDAGKLAKQVAFLDSHPEHALVGTSGTAIDEQGKELFPISYPQSDAELRPLMLRKDPFINCSVVFRKAAAIEAGGYCQDENYAEDYGLWLRIGRDRKFENLPDSSIGYRITSTGITQTRQIAHTQNSYRAALRNKEYYPNFALAWLKWNAKLLILNMGGAGTIKRVKSALKK